ncbi:MAG TPA: FAD:protein FMN transferase [Anaerolineales bacterium]|nr:FAD:protein FMN transferase [Anaerolineales bacterium]
MEYFEFRAMNSSIVLAAEGGMTADGFAATQDYIETAEQRFSRFRPDSELSLLNQSAGSRFAASLEMQELLKTALECHVATDGLFNPFILKDLQRIGYTRSMDEIRKVGALDAEAIAGTRVGRFALIQIDESGKVFLPQEYQIDLGGIAKGWTAERAARILSEFSPVCGVNAGGDMFLIGQPQGQAGWEIGLEDPRNPSKDLFPLWVNEGAVATSSIAKRTWLQGDKARHHLIDPRTGDPAQTPWLSVTFFAPQAAVAETFAKAVLIGGLEYAQDLVAKDPEINFLAVSPDGGIWSSLNKKEIMRVE